MFRSCLFCLFVAGITAGCATPAQRVTSGGYYCTTETEQPCPSHEGSGDCQPCPNAVAAPSTASAAPAASAIIASRQD